ncbi:LysR family transcriptional regulator [Paenibacillus sp. FSL L8-0494]|uniref:LysR family transcriptional regulator n=1 Tax=Paenibacillus sp. FSL L8-0494 TaxID=2975352 RepID=UPI0030FBE980
MDTRKLRYFVTIVDSDQNITKAAKLLNLAQPPLSQQVKLLEEELGVSLFERHGKRLYLTQSGEVLYQQAVKILQSIEDARCEVMETAEGLRGKLNIGIYDFYSGLIAEKIRIFSNKYPLVTFKILEHEPQQLIGLLKDRTIDLAFVNLPIPMDDFSVRIFGDHGLACAVPNNIGGDFTGHDVSLYELKDIPWIILKRDSQSGLQPIILNECSKLGITPNILCESNNVESVLALVNAGLGAAIFPAFFVQHAANPKYRILNLKDISLKMESAVIWMKERYLSKQARLFLELFE